MWLIQVWSPFNVYILSFPFHAVSTSPDWALINVIGSTHEQELYNIAVSGWYGRDKDRAYINIRYVLQVKQWWPWIPSLTHWGWVIHICVNKLPIIGSDNGLSPGRHQAIIWTNAGLLLIGPLGTNFSEIWIEIYMLSFKKMHLKISSGKWQPCLGLNSLTNQKLIIHLILFFNMNHSLKWTLQNH